MGHGSACCSGEKPRCSASGSRPFKLRPAPSAAAFLLPSPCMKLTLLFVLLSLLPVVPAAQNALPAFSTGLSSHQPLGSSPGVSDLGSSPKGLPPSSMLSQPVCALSPGSRLLEPVRVLHQTDCSWRAGTPMGGDWSVWDLASGCLQGVPGLPGTWGPGAIFIGGWVRSKGLASGIVGLFKHDSFIEILFPPRGGRKPPYNEDSKDSGMFHSPPVAFASHHLG